MSHHSLSPAKSHATQLATMKMKHIGENECDHIARNAIVCNSAYFYLFLPLNEE